MSMNDPISDLLTRIRNGYAAKKAVVAVPASKMLMRILDVLQREGYIRGYSQNSIREGISELNVELKYYEGTPVITQLKRISRPGRRVYSELSQLPRVFNGLGIAILSTSHGVLSDAEARKENVGGEIICEVF